MCFDERALRVLSKGKTGETRTPTMEECAKGPHLSGFCGPDPWRLRRALRSPVARKHPLQQTQTANEVRHAIL